MRSLTDLDAQYDSPVMARQHSGGAGVLELVSSHHNKTCDVQEMQSNVSSVRGAAVSCRLHPRVDNCISYRWLTLCDLSK